MAFPERKDSSDGRAQEATKENKVQSEGEFQLLGISFEVDFILSTFFDLNEINSFLNDSLTAISNKT